MNKPTENPFYIPQRQSFLGIIILFSLSFKNIIKAFWPLLIVVFFSKKESSNLLIYISIFAFIGFMMLKSFLDYWFFKFYIDPSTREFVVLKGYINKTKLSIKLDRIQQVNMQQEVMHKILGIYKLEIDTAGSTQNEVSIKGIHKIHALLLKEELLRNDNPEEPKIELEENIQSEKTSSIFQLNWTSILKVGVTSRYIETLGLLFLFFIFIQDFVSKLEQNNLVDEQSLEKQIDNIAWGEIFLFLFIFSILLIVSINIIRTLFKFFDYKVVKNGKNLVLTYGLLNTRNTILKPEKVQVINISQNYFQKKWNFSNLKISQASSALNVGQLKDQLHIPGCSDEEQTQFFDLIYDCKPYFEIEVQPHVRKFVVSWLIFALAPALAFSISGFLLELSLFNLLAIVGIYISLVTVLVYVYYKNYKLKVSKDFIQKQSGVWDVDKIIIEPYKIQSIIISQFFWQKRKNIGSISLFTAGGNFSFNVTQYDQIQQLANYWLYQTESTHRSWM